MKPSILLAIPHTPWVPERVESCARLRKSLFGADVPVGDTAFPGVAGVKFFEGRAANHVWSEELWTWGGAHGRDRAEPATHLLQLQDDAVVPASGFWRAIGAMLEAVPDQVIGLEAPHPGGMTVAREGGRWYTTADCLVGVGYVVPCDLLRDFLAWRSTALKPGAVEAITEDTLIAMWCVATSRRIWHPVPTLIDHDTAIASTYGNDEHPFRRPSVTWKDGDVGGWELADLERSDFWVPLGVPHLGRFYPTVHHQAAVWSKGFTPKQAEGVEGDHCPPKYARHFR